MKKTTLILMRHGEVENPRRVLYGRLPNFRLSERGRQQVRDTAEELKNIPVSHIYSSPLLRARQTAGIVKQSLPVSHRISRLIIEVDLIFQGMSVTEYKKIQGDIYDEKYLKKGQESINVIAARMEKFARLIKRRHSGKTILAVSHGDPIVIYKALREGGKFTWSYKRNNYLKTAGWLPFEI